MRTTERRLVLGVTFSLLAACAGASPTTESSSSTVGPLASTTTTVALAPTTTIPADPYAQPGWLTIENAQPGSPNWKITKPVPGTRPMTAEGSIEGYIDTTSARPGDTVTMFVATSAESWRVEAYRMGWYNGDQGRLIWQSENMGEAWQLNNATNSKTRMARALWDPSLTFDIDDSWPPGSYLLKLVSSTDEAHYVPLTVRRDTASASLVVVSAVTTWQAYNPWGVCSLYECFDGARRSRATVVSFDRPYAASYNWGSADFLTHELPLISLIEEIGIDTAYVTDVDLHTSGLPDSTEPNSVFTNRTALLTTGHDEYYSTAMRATLENARAAGINLAFFGANAVYRHIRLEPNDEGQVYRQMANYRTADADPMTATDPSQSTVQWRNPPLARPESELIGVQYFGAGVNAAMVLVDTDNWIFEGVDVTNGTSLSRLVTIEADELGPASLESDNLQVLASSPTRYAGRLYHHAMTYYTAASGAGVFATGTIGWIISLDPKEWGDEEVTAIVRGVTANVLRAFAAGPTGQVYPSVGNADRYRRVVTPDAGPSTTEVPNSTIAFNFGGL